MRKWHAKFAAIRKQLDMTESEAPWTQRAGVELRGLRRQGGARFFLHELIDCRWGRFAKGNKMEVSDEPQADVTTDYGKSDDRQRATGSIVLHTNSHVYWHNRDRVLIPEEHFGLQGWDIGGINFQGLADPFPDEILQAIDPQTSAKRR